MSAVKSMRHLKNIFKLLIVLFEIFCLSLSQDLN